MYRLTRVTIEETEPLEAYISDRRWNGWVMPYFTRRQVDAYLTWQNGKAATSASFDEEADAVVTQFENEEPDVWLAENIVIDGRTLHVYGVGAGCWIWEEAQ